MEKGLPQRREKNANLIMRALTDPQFRKKLEENPTSALGVKRLSKDNEREIQSVLAIIKCISAQVAAAADELLCASGPGPCGIV